MWPVTPTSPCKALSEKQDAPTIRAHHNQDRSQYSLPCVECSAAHQRMHFCAGAQYGRVLLQGHTALYRSKPHHKPLQVPLCSLQLTSACLCRS